MKILLFAFFCSSLFGSYDFQNPHVQLPCAFLPNAKRCNPSDTSEVFDLFLKLDFLWWEGMERGLEYALKNVTQTFHEKIQIYEPNFGFHPAFRIGAGSHFNYDHWDMALSYTRYYTTSKTHANHSSSNGGIRSVWTSATAFNGNNFRTLWQDSEAKWKLHTHIFDLLLKTDFCLSSAMSIKPGFGLKMALIQQRYSVQYGSGNTAPDVTGFPITYISSKIAMKNRSFNLGIAAKIDTTWNLFNHFDFLGNLGASLMATHFEVGRNEFDVSINQNDLFILQLLAYCKLIVHFFCLKIVY